jgi:hypothetical protein
MCSDGAAPGRTTGCAQALAWSVLGAMFLYRISLNVADLDLYHQMALAREALRLGAIPKSDVFAFTPVLPTVVHHEWGAGFIALAVAGVLGGGGILALKYGLGAALALLTVRTAARVGGNLASVAFAAPIAIVLADEGFSPVRPQLYTFLFAAITLACAERDRVGDRRWIVLHAALFVVWVNLHGGFVIGPALLAAYAIEARMVRKPVRHVAALIGIEALLVMVNPWGPAYYPYLVRALTMGRPRIHEWDPLWAAGIAAADRYAFVIAVVLVAYALWRGGTRGAKGLVILAVTALAALRANRMLPIFALAWLTYVPALLRRTPLPELVASAARRHPRASRVAAAAMALVFLVLLGRARAWNLQVPARPAGQSGNAQLAYPVGAVAFLRASAFRGNLMTTFETGAYVSWKLHPAVKVSLDSRYEAAYPEAVFEDVLAFYEGRERPEDVLARYGAACVRRRKLRHLRAPGARDRAVERGRRGARPFPVRSRASTPRPLARALRSGRTDSGDRDVLPFTGVAIATASRSSSRSGT